MILKWLLSGEQCRWELSATETDQKGPKRSQGREESETFNSWNSSSWPFFSESCLGSFFLLSARSTERTKPKACNRALEVFSGISFLIGSSFSPPSVRLTVKQSLRLSWSNDLRNLYHVSLSSSLSSETTRLFNDHPHVAQLPNFFLCCVLPHLVSIYIARAHHPVDECRLVVCFGFLLSFADFFPLSCLVVDFTAMMLSFWRPLKVSQISEDKNLFSTVHKVPFWSSTSGICLMSDGCVLGLSGATR